MHTNEYRSIISPCKPTKKTIPKKEDIYFTLGMEKRALSMNTNSTQNSLDMRISGHSTPCRIKNVDIIEDSPELTYSCSPILIPLTQDGGNEVAWDWQSSIGKTPYDIKNTEKCNQTETPKRSKLLQKKRNSNSPLLHKPLKRKLVRMQNMESIGKFAAELQALTEKMNIIKEDNKKYIANKGTSDKNELQSISNIEVRNVSDEVKVDHRIDKSINKDASDSITKSSYEELFDDSIDDSMVRCSQEVEEKLILGGKKENGVELSVVCEEIESPGDRKSALFLMTSNNSSEESKPSSIFNSPPNFNINNCVKTYTKMYPTENGNSNRDATKRNYVKNTSFKVDSEIPFNKKVLLGRSRTHLSLIPDDSFDECLATCVADGDSLPAIKNHSTIENKTLYAKKCPKSSNTLSSNSMLIGNFCQNKVADVQATLNKHNIYEYNGQKHFSHNSHAAEVTILNTSSTTDRKFFKSKSLSDSYFGHESNNSKHNNVNDNRQKGKQLSNCMLPSKNRNNSHSNTQQSPVSNHLLQNQNTYKDKLLTGTNDMGNVLTLNVNRFGGKGGGSDIVRSNSLNNLNNIAKEGGQTVRAGWCTADEIEKKRLDALMKLQTKQQLRLRAQCTTSLEESVKKLMKG